MCFWQFSSASEMMRVHHNQWNWCNGSGNNLQELFVKLQIEHLTKIFLSKLNHFYYKFNKINTFYNTKIILYFSHLIFKKF